MHITKFFYNVETKECEFFVYSGCGGNANNFMTAVECESNCKKGTAIIVQVPMKEQQVLSESSTTTSNNNNTASSISTTTTTPMPSAASSTASMQSPPPITTASINNQNERKTAASPAATLTKLAATQTSGNKRTMPPEVTRTQANTPLRGRDVRRTFVLNGEDCKDSPHGCCLDGNSPASGDNGEGCPESKFTEPDFFQL